MPTLEAPASGVTVRMFRHGHGDCFLLAFARAREGDDDGDDAPPVYVLIDCGYKPGSPGVLRPGLTMGDIAQQIAEATGGRLDLVVVTHEHEDHVNGFPRVMGPGTGALEVHEAWMAWTEDPDDAVANALRTKHGDVLVQLAEAREQLAIAGAEHATAVYRLDGLLAFELGDASPAAAPGAMLAAARNAAASGNKAAMRLVKDEARKHRGVRFLRPGSPPREVPGTAGVRVFVLGPPRRPDLLSDEDPVGEEAFPRPGSGGHGLSFGDAVAGPDARSAPFSTRHCVALEHAMATEPFFREHYGEGAAGHDDRDRIEVPGDAAWRRIDHEWLHSAETLALKLNTGINNTSLVLAFELPASRKVLLFVGDAQRGSWISWADHAWDDGDTSVTARDLLARTVLYKVGHHGSHNATLAGSAESTYANLSWMEHGELAAMIPAVNEWAMGQTPPWVHPLPSIRRALLKRAQGRVFQTDVDRPRRPSAVAKATWDAFLGRAAFEDLYFDYTIPDE